MSLKFNPYKNVRIDRVKAHISYLKPPKQKNSHRDTDYVDKSDVPLIIRQTPNLMAGKKKTNLDMDKVFDIKEDGKLKKVKKETKAQKLSRHYVMLDGKKYHEINGKFQAMS